MRRPGQPPAQFGIVGDDRHRVARATRPDCDFEWNIRQDLCARYDLFHRKSTSVTAIKCQAVAIAQKVFDGREMGDGGEFMLFVTRLAYQLMMSCGLLENPVTKGRQVHLDNARMLLADLAMLREKTVGNLNEDEAAHIDKVLNDLRPLVAKLISDGGQG